MPLLTSPYVTGGDIWGIPNAFSFTVLRNNTSLATSEDAYFSSDRVGVRATMRVAFAFPHETAVVRIGEPDAS